MEDSLRLFLSLQNPEQAGVKRDCPFASPSPSPDTTTFLPYSPPPSPYPYPYPYLSNYRAAPQSESLLNKPRAPPPRPTPLDFPRHVPETKPRPLSRRSMRELRRAILCARRPTDNTDEVFNLMNVQLTQDVPLDSSDFVPTDFLPQRPFLFDADLEAMLAELNTENEDAFREVLRQRPREGRPKPRVAYSRNFFGSLEDMSRYCDSTGDHYFEMEEEEASESKDGKNSSTGGVGSEEKKDAEGDSEMADSTSANTSDPSPIQPSDSNTKTTKEMYTGPRLGNSSQLPPGTRTSAVRNLLKMVMHKFTCRDYDLSPRERLRIRDINIPPAFVMSSFVVARLPNDRALARARHVEGPVMGVSVRHETVFSDALYKRLLEQEKRERNEIGDCLGAPVDLLREIGAGLAIALQRGREGRKKDAEHERVTQRWWWAKTPRWGGAPTRWGMLANEVFEDEDPSWSPTERELQMQKREKTQEEMKRIDDVAGKVNGEVKVEDLLAKTEAQAGSPGTDQKPGSGPGPMVGLLSETSVRIPTLTPIITPAYSSTRSRSSSSSSSSSTRSVGSDEPITADDASTNTSSSSGGSNTDSDRPPKKKHRLAINERVSQLSRLGLSPSSSSSSSSSPASSPASREDKRDKDREEKAEYKDGRRLMYTAPMRRKWYREWTQVKPNSSGWDEKVLWRRVGAPLGNSGDGHGDGEGMAAAGAEGNAQESAVPAHVEDPSGSSDAKADADADADADAEAKAKVNAAAPAAPAAQGDWDEVFLLSCVNHHVAILKMRVSSRYLTWLENGDAEAEMPLLSGTTTAKKAGAEADTGTGTGTGVEATAEKGLREEDILQVCRSEYHDLFDVRQRKELLVALWRVMSWVCRREVAEGEWERTRALRAERGHGQEKGGQGN